MFGEPEGKWLSMCGKCNQCCKVRQAYLRLSAGLLRGLIFCIFWRALAPIERPGYQLDKLLEL